MHPKVKIQYHLLVETLLALMVFQSSSLIGANQASWHWILHKSILNKPEDLKSSQLQHFQHNISCWNCISTRKDRTVFAENKPAKTVVPIQTLISLHIFNTVSWKTMLCHYNLLIYKSCLCIMYLVFWPWVSETTGSLNRIEKNYRWWQCRMQK